MTDVCELTWRKDGKAWLLLAGRRRMGRVVPDAKHRGLYRSVLSGGRLSDMANLSWAKNAVLLAAEREQEFEQRSANYPRKTQQKGGISEAPSSLVR